MLFMSHNPAAVETIRSLGHQSPKDFSKLFPTASAPAIDLLARMLQFDPGESTVFSQHSVSRSLALMHTLCRAY
jgi:hypothetical protein